MKEPIIPFLCVFFVNDYEFVCGSFPFSFEGRLLDLIVLIPDHSLSFYFVIVKMPFLQWKTIFMTSVYFSGQQTLLNGFYSRGNRICLLGTFFFF